VAGKPDRFTEARLYVVAGSIGLMLVVWATFAVADRMTLATPGAQTSTGQSQLDTRSQVAQQPQTHTRGS
jgi:hypothetical protein